MISILVIQMVSGCKSTSGQGQLKDSRLENSTKIYNCTRIAPKNSEVAKNINLNFPSSDTARVWSSDNRTTINQIDRDLTFNRIKSGLPARISNRFFRALGQPVSEFRYERSGIVTDLAGTPSHVPEQTFSIYMVTYEPALTEDGSNSYPNEYRFDCR